MLKPAKEHGVKIIINMGAVNPHAAVMKVMEIAEEQGITGLKFAAVTGDSIDDSIEQYYDEEILEFKGKVADWKDQIVSANVYMGAEGIIEHSEMARMYYYRKSGGSDTDIGTITV